MERSFRASAPGRLDVMGGVADYSGSLVLEGAISLETSVTARFVPGGAASVTVASEAWGEVEVPLAVLFDGLRGRSLGEVRAGL